MEQMIDEMQSAPATRPMFAPPTYIMQCAKSKRDGGYWRDANGTQVKFIANSEKAPQDREWRYARPDGQADDGRSWRSHLTAYNREYQKTGHNPLGLHPAATLYTASAYAKLFDAIPAKRLYILSAAWGLVRSDYLLANYDVSFSQSQSVPSYSRRGKAGQWKDFNMLDQMAETPVIFIGGLSYLATFADLTRHYQGPRIAYTNSQSVSAIDGVELRRFQTTTKTNWHYGLVAALLGDTQSKDQFAAPSTLVQNGNQRAEDKQPRRQRSDLGKYAPIFDFLKNLSHGQQFVTLSYEKMEFMLGAKLPESSRTRAPMWWANGGHTQAHAWMKAGFRKVAHHIGASNDESWVRFEREK